MCIIGFLTELFCCVAEGAEEFEQVTSIVEEIKQSISETDELKHLTSDELEKADSTDQNVDSNIIDQSGKEFTVTKALTATIQANPTVSAIKNTVGAIQDYRNGEDIKDIVKDRTIQMVEDQVPGIVLQKVQAEVSNETPNI